MENFKPSWSKGQASIVDSLQPLLHDPTKVAQLKLAVFITEYASNLSTDHLGELVPQLDNKSNTVKKIKMHRSKCSRLQKPVLGPGFTKQLRDEIKDQHFSLIVDESTNETKVSCLALTIRFFSPSKRAIVDTFYRLVPLKDTTADTVYQAIKVCLKEDELDVNKLV